MFLYKNELDKNEFHKCENKILMIFFCKLHSLNNSKYIILHYFTYLL